MSDRLFFGAAAVVAAVMIIVAMIWPQAI